MPIPVSVTLIKTRSPSPRTFTQMPPPLLVYLIAFSIKLLIISRRKSTSTAAKTSWLITRPPFMLAEEEEPKVKWIFFSLIFGIWPSAIERTVEVTSIGRRCALILLSSSFVTSRRSLNNLPRCWEDLCASSRYFFARSSIVAVFGFKANPRYPSIDATGVRISWEAVEINSVCSLSASSSEVIS